MARLLLLIICLANPCGPEPYEWVRFSNGPRTTENGQRAAGVGQRESGSGQRAETSRDNWTFGVADTLDDGRPLGTVPRLLPPAACLPSPGSGSAAQEEQQQEPQTDPVDPLAGFDDTFTVSVEPAPEQDSSRFDLGGFARLATSFGMDHERPAPGEADWRGLSRLRADLQLEAEVRLGEWRLFGSGRAFHDLVYSLRSDSGYPAPVVREYESEVELREAWLRGMPARGTTLTLGRQIVVWGRSDTFRVVDVVNPLDLREPGLVDIEDLRLPVASARLDVELGRWVLGLLAVPEVRFDKNPVPGHDLFPFPPDLPLTLLAADDPGGSEFAVSLDTVRSGWDLSLYAARFYADTPTFEEPYRFPLEHRRLDMAGAAFGLARGNTLVFAEAAVVEGLGYLAAPGEDFTRTDLLLGLEYNAPGETVIAVEAVDRHIHGFHEGLLLSPEQLRHHQVQTAVRVNCSLLHDKLQLVLLSVQDGLEAEQGWWQRLTARYELAAGLSATAGVVLFHGGDGLLEELEQADRLVFELRYDF